MSPPADAPRVCLETFGCQMNVYDSHAMGGLLAEGGFAAAGTPEGADVALLNTCSVREHAEQRIFSRVGELARSRRLSGRPRLIGLCGCLAERLGGRLLARGGEIDLAVGVDRYRELPALLADLLAARAAPERALTGHLPEVHYVAPPEAAPRGGSHLVTIHKGCDYRCTYCVVPLTRGPQREKAPEVILAEIERIVAAGGREVTLLGQNVTAYRWRGELDFADLLRRVAAIAGLRRIRFLTGHPRDLHERLLRAIAELPAVCPALHVPMQSGSDRVLRRMKRLYAAADYFRMVDRARELLPGATFSGDFIVGFPGEGEDDFRATLEAVRRVRYDQLFSFKYSPRPGAPASRLPDDVPTATKKRRLAELMATQEETWARTAAAQVGAAWRVVLEEPARRPPGHWRGRTANNRKVLLPAADGAPGQERMVQITGWRHTTFAGRPLPEAR